MATHYTSLHTQQQQVYRRDSGSALRLRSALGGLLLLPLLPRRLLAGCTLLYALNCPRHTRRRRLQRAHCNKRAEPVVNLPHRHLRGWAVRGAEK